VQGYLDGVEEHLGGQLPEFGLALVLENDQELFSLSLSLAVSLSLCLSVSLSLSFSLSLSHTDGARNLDGVEEHLGSQLAELGLALVQGLGFRVQGLGFRV